MEIWPLTALMNVWNLVSSYVAGRSLPNFAGGIGASAWTRWLCINVGIGAEEVAICRQVVGGLVVFQRPCCLGTVNLLEVHDALHLRRILLDVRFAAQDNKQEEGKFARPCHITSN